MCRSPKTYQRMSVRIPDVERRRTSTALIYSQGAQTRTRYGCIHDAEDHCGKISEKIYVQERTSYMTCRCNARKKRWFEREREREIYKRAGKNSRVGKEGAFISGRVLPKTCPPLLRFLSLCLLQDKNATRQYAFAKVKRKASPCTISSFVSSGSLCFHICCIVPRYTVMTGDPPDHGLEVPIVTGFFNFAINLRKWSIK